MRHTFSFLMAGLLTVASAAAQVRVTPPRTIDQPGNGGSKVGLNVADFTYYSSEVVFTDIFRGCSEWIPQLVTGGPWNTGATIAQRVDGYPSSLAAGQAVASLINVGMGSRYPGGEYVAMWDGDGDVELRWDATEISRTANRILARVGPNQGILLRIIRTNPANPVRNLRLVPKLYEFAHRILPFHPSFIERWRIARVLRFMDWQKTNSTYISAWADRVQPDYYTQQGRDGAAVEHMVDLCNYLGTDPWFCMPHLATDDFVRQFARLVAGRLRAGLKCYVEYSNECWNGSFVQAGYCREMGVRLNLSTDAYEAQLRYYSQRSVEVFRIWEQEMTRARIVRVLAGQNVNTWGATRILDWQNAFQSTDAWALNAYFGHDLGDPANQVRVQNMDPVAILAECAQDIPRAMAFTAQQQVVAQQRNLPIIAFEAGQHMAAWGSASGNYRLTDKLVAANRLPGMRQVYDAFLTEWRRVGGGMCCLFNTTAKFGQYGSWGLFEDSLQSMWDAPKFLGVVDNVVRNWGR